LWVSWWVCSWCSIVPETSVWGRQALHWGNRDPRESEAVRCSHWIVLRPPPLNCRSTLYGYRSSGSRPRSPRTLASDFWVCR
jgi:hypothetical protein